MIKTVADLLQALMVREKDVLADQDVDHGPTIGDMYEGLTRDVLDRSLPVETVAVTTGFARGKDGAKSRQLDCMIVVGEGDEIPYTDAQVYPVERVLAVVEVKKTLYQSEFKDALENLRSVTRLEPSTELSVGSAVRHAFSMVTGKSVPEDWKTLSDPTLLQVFGVLVNCACNPTAVLLGYEGYGTTTALRRGLVSHLETLVGMQGGGPVSLPDLIMNPNGAVLKANGFPYAVPLLDDNWWPVLLSNVSADPSLVLLEILWSRLCMRLGGMPELFGEDLHLEQVARLVDFRFVPDEEGWELRAFPEYKPTEHDAQPERPWEPLVLSATEHTLLLWLINKGDLDMRDPPSGAPVQELQVALARLQKERVVGPDAEHPTVYRLLTKNLATAILPDKGYVCGENVSGRLARWIAKNYPPG